MAVVDAPEVSGGEEELTPLPRFHAAFAALVAVFLVLGIWITVEELFPEYRRYQGRFAARLAALAGEAGPESPAPARFERGVQQVLLEGYTRADRCITCHLGIDDASFADAPQPLTSHPGRLLESHPPQSFGCVYCHGGEGTATSFERAAHAPRENIADPIAPGALLEARCGACHRGLSVAEAPRLSLGRKLIVDRQCAGCHEIPGPMGAEPARRPLDGIGVKVGAGWLDRWLADPSAYLPRHRMPQFLLAEDDRKALVAFLASRTDPPVPVPPPPAEGDSEAGGVLFRESRCISCHSLEGRGGTLAPDLAKIGSKTSPRWLLAYLRDPAGMNPRTLMPRFNFSEGELLDLVAYLSEELVDLDAEEEEVAGGAEPGTPAADAALAAKGRDLFLERGCTGCHSLEGVLDPGRIGAEIAEIGSLPFDKFVFPGDYRGPRTRAAWLAEKIRDPRLGVETAPLMPRFRATAEERAAMAIALLSLRGDAPPPELRAPDPAPPAFDPQGQFGRVIRRYRCFTCHRMRGRGGDISRAPLDFEGSLARKEWLFSFLKLPYTIRPLVPERMPRFRMTDAEARTLTEFLSGVMVDDSVGEPALSGPPDERRLREGEEVYARLGCAACHIRRGRGGYVGPRLDGVGARMTPAWIRAFLADPRRYRPDVVMPAYDFSEEELDALTALLTTLKDVGFGRTPMAVLGVAELRLGAPPADASRATLASALASFVESDLGIPVRGVRAPDLTAFLGMLRREEIDVLIADPLQAVVAGEAAGYEPLAVTDGPPETFVVVGVPGGDLEPTPEEGPLALARTGDLADAVSGPAGGPDRAGELEGRDLLVFGSVEGAVRAVLAGQAAQALLRGADLEALAPPLRRRLVESRRFRARPRSVLLVRGSTPYRLAAGERRALLGLFGPGAGERPAPDSTPARDPREEDAARAKALLSRTRSARGGTDPLLAWR